MNIKQTFQKIRFLNETYTKMKWREKKVSNGTENKEKCFYIVRRANAKVGLFSLVLTSLGYIKHAVDRGCIPVVDMSNYRNSYAGYGDNNPNIWEYYFQQPGKYNLEDINQSKKIVLGNGIISDKVEYPDDEIAYDDKKLLYWKEVAGQYLKVEDTIARETELIQDKMFGKSRVLGVLARGTDYINARPYNHPVQPTPEQLMEKIDQVMQAQKCDKIYLATEDSNIYALFQEKYQDRLFSMDVERFETEGKENINEVRQKQKRSGYLAGKDYLITILLLSRCHCLVAGNTSGSLGALLLNKQYDYKYIFNLGVYGRNEEEE